jgi:hypothetical protein
MTEKQYHLLGDTGKFGMKGSHYVYDISDAVDVMNALHEENKNTKAVLNDFMSILNRLQANPTNNKLLGISRDMLQNMGVELE